MRFRQSTWVVLTLGIATGFMAARGGGNSTPGSNVASAFESYLFQSPDNGWVDFLNGLSQQGYIVQRFKNEVFDDDPESATISNLVAAGQSGVLGLLHVHGNSTGASLEVYKKTSRRDAAFDAYIAAGWNQNGTEIAKSDFWSGSYLFHNVRIQEVGFANRIKPQAEARDAISYAGGVCNSFGFMDDMGGRTQFGNDGVPNFWFRNLSEFFGLLSGIRGDGRHRSAGAAIVNGSYDEVVRLTGLAETTLCPSTSTWGPTGEAVCEGGRIAGSVTFDTAVSEALPLDQMLFVSDNAGPATTGWSEPGTTIAFTLDRLADGQTVIVTVVAENVQSAANGTRLDGNQSPPGSHGTRPNADDFIYSFTCLIDGDADGVRDSQDNCPTLTNPDQRRVGFTESMVATSPDALTWSTPTDVRYVKGDLLAVETYDVLAEGILQAATSLDLTGEAPAIGAGWFYLVRYDGACGSWAQNGSASQRDPLLL